MSNQVILSPRDRSLLRFLSWTPATTSLLQQASQTFEGGAFQDERRLRERLQTLRRAKLVHAWSTAHAGGGLQNYYKLTPLGYQVLLGEDVELPPRSFFGEVSPALFNHTFRLAEVIVTVLMACHMKRVTIAGFIRENELTFSTGKETVQPDCFFRLEQNGKPFNLAFEIDNSTESLDSAAANSVGHKLKTYLAYQDSVLHQWQANGKTWERPRLRVVFLTPSMDRAHHILSLASEMTQHPARRVIYAATWEEFVTADAPLHTPLFLDHLGHWQALVDLHPTAAFHKTPVRLARPVQSPWKLW